MSKYTLADFKKAYEHTMANAETAHFPTLYEGLMAAQTLEHFSVFFNIGPDEYMALNQVYYSWLSPYAGGDKWMTLAERKAAKETK